MDNELQQKLNIALGDHQYEVAFELCQELLKQDVNTPHLKAVKGWCAYKLGQHKAAQVLLVEAFNQDPLQHYSASMLMTFYMERGYYHQVVTLGQFCVGAHAKDRLMWHRLATAHFMLGDVEGAVIAFRRSLEVEYTKITAFALSQPLLCQGKYKEGFELYEHRLTAYPKINWPQHERMPMPQWQGESLRNKSLLVWSEQGLGDCIQFSRIISVLADQGASVDLMLPQAHGALAEMLDSLSGLNDINVISHNQVKLKRAYDFQSPMMSLMKGIQLTKDSIPEPSFPYLSLPSDNKLMQYNVELQALLQNVTDKKLKVGIVWTTALRESFKQRDYLHFKQKNRKSLSTDDVLPLLEVDFCEFFSLHVEKSEALQDVLDTQNIVDASVHLKSFTDTAIAIDAMDLIVSIDTSVAHLAGAMNKPVVNLLPFSADWRWQNNREDTPWYPSMRLLRQVFADDWSDTVKRLEKLLLKINIHYQETGDISIF